MLLRLERTPANVTKANDLLEDAYALNHDLFETELKIHPQTSYRSVPYAADDQRSTDNSTWRPSLAHIYPSIEAAKARNKSRLAQLLCARIVNSALKWQDAENCQRDGRYRASEYKMRYLVDDIAASVPFLLDAEKPANSEYLSTAERSPDRRGAESLSWPLYVSCNLSEVPEPQREWLREKLRLIEHKYGLNATGMGRMNEASLTPDQAGLSVGSGCRLSPSPSLWYAT